MHIDTHGADIYTASEKSGIHRDSILDFSSNINPLGIPESVKNAAIIAIEKSNKYPDINSRELIKAISAAENVPKEWIFPSNGAAEAIYRIVAYLKPKNGLVTAPAFSEYEASLKAAGAEIKYHLLHEEQGFIVNDDVLKSIDDETDIVFLCNPNNPTGQLIKKATIEKILNSCRDVGAYVVVDECFLDFVENKNEYSVVNLLEMYDNLIVLKAFTKIYAIPGMRLGYCMSSNLNVIDKLKAFGPPWNVSSIAQEAGIAALKEKDYVKSTIQFVKNERSYLYDELKKLQVKVFYSYANYLLFKISIPMDLKERLLEKGILIRSCSNYKNLSSSFYRIAVKSHEENNLFVEALKEVLKIYNREESWLKS